MATLLLLAGTLPIVPLAAMVGKKITKSLQSQSQSRSQPQPGSTASRVPLVPQPVSAHKQRRQNTTTSSHFNEHQYMSAYLPKSHGIHDSRWGEFLSTPVRYHERQHVTLSEPSEANRGIDETQKIRRRIRETNMGMLSRHFNDQAPPNTNLKNIHGRPFGHEKGPYAMNPETVPHQTLLPSMQPEISGQYRSQGDRIAVSSGTVRAKQYHKILSQDDLRNHEHERVPIPESSVIAQSRVQSKYEPKYIHSTRGLTETGPHQLAGNHHVTAGSMGGVLGDLNSFTDDKNLREQLSSKPQPNASQGMQAALLPDLNEFKDRIQNQSQRENVGVVPEGNAHSLYGTAVGALDLQTFSEHTTNREQLQRTENSNRGAPRQPSSPGKQESSMWYMNKNTRGHAARQEEETGNINLAGASVRVNGVFSNARKSDSLVSEHTTVNERFFDGPERSSVHSLGEDRTIVLSGSSQKQAPNLGGRIDPDQQVNKYHEVRS